LLDVVRDMAFLDLNPIFKAKQAVIGVLDRIGPDMIGQRGQ
jgi:hypothetical protein